jgi:hypothetical protein
MNGESIVRGIRMDKLNDAGTIVHFNLSNEE